MADQALTVQRATPIPRPELRLVGRICVALLIVLGVGALAGGIALLAEPDGSVMQFDVTLLEGSPFTDFALPGVILGGLFGVGSLLVAVMGLRRVPVAPFLAFGIGCAQMIWIGVQLAIIEEVSFLHPTFFGVGCVIAVSAAVWGWPTFEGWRASR